MMRGRASHGTPPPTGTRVKEAGMRARIGVVVAVSALALTMAGCGGNNGGSGGGDLEGVSWVLVSYRGTNGSTEQVPSEAEVTARFESGTVAGNGGCNAYTGPYTLSGSDLAVGPVASTKMACPSPLNALEQAYFTNLEAAAAFTADQSSLIIRNEAGDDVLTYQQRQDLPLAGTTWTMTSYNNGKQAVVTAVAGTDVTLLLTEDGKVSGSGGCNQYSGDYTTDGDSISFGPLASTQMACEDPDVNAQEAAYLAALGTVSSFRLEGDRLDLLAADDSLAASFEGASTSSS
jgi:heat shock protein HslJ